MNRSIRPHPTCADSNDPSFGGTPVQWFVVDRLIQRSGSFIALGAMLVLLVLASLWSAASAAAIPTESGLLEGVQENGITMFKGVPFAAPPIGALRWRAPQAPAAWSGIRSADKFAPICMQHGSYPEDAPPEPMSEDCLYLNVWVPPRAAGDKLPTTGKLPVMVWIYGGGLENGSASTPLYAGDMLARKGVIVVTANYRLGVNPRTTCRETMACSISLLHWDGSIATSRHSAAIPSG